MPSTNSPVEPLPARARQRLAHLRLLGSASMQLGYLLVPFLVFKLTGDLALVGAALLMDGVARALSQFFSGSLLATVGPAAVHVRTEALRTLALVGLLLCALGHLPPVFVVPMGFALQLATSATITLYAHTTTLYWPVSEQAAAHHHQGFLEQLGCLGALVASIVWPQPWVMATGGVALQVVTCVILFRHLRELHPKTHSLAGEATPVGARALRDFKASVRRPLLRLSAGSILVYAAALTGFALPVFMFSGADVPHDKVGAWVASAMLFKTLVSLVSMHTAKRWAAAGGSSARIGRVGHVLICLGVAMMALPLPAPLLAAAIVGMGTGASLLTPQLRFVRQRLIIQMVEPRSRAGATGMLSAMDAGGFGLAALLVLTGASLAWTYALAALACAMGLPLLQDGYARAKR